MASAAGEASGQYGSREGLEGSAASASVLTCAAPALLLSLQIVCTLGPACRE